MITERSRPGEPVAPVRSVVRRRAIAGLVVLALVTTMAVPVVGSLLIFSLLIGPAGAARSFTNRPPVAMGLSVVFALVTVWVAIAVSYETNLPIGFFVGAISAFALRDLNLTKIESRPLRGKPWEYLFYLDFLGRADSPAAVNALNHLGEIADFLRILGCYPKGA